MKDIIIKLKIVKGTYLEEVITFKSETTSKNTIMIQWLLL